MIQVHFIAVLVADLDYTEIDAMFHDVNSQNNKIKLVNYNNMSGVTYRRHIFS